MKNLFRGLIFKIVSLILFIEVIVLFILGLLNTLYFSNRLEIRFQEQIQVPGKLLIEGALKYRSINDAQIMQQFVGEDLQEALMVGIDRKVYYSLNPKYRDKLVPEIENLEFISELNERIVETVTYKSGGFYYSITPIRSETQKLLGYFYVKAGIAQLEADKSGVILRFVWGSLVAIAVTALIGFFASYIFSRRMAKLIALLRGISEGEGDLTKRIAISSSDELGEIAHNYNLFAEKLREIIEKVKFLVDNLATAFKEVSVSTDEISINTSQQNEQMKHLLSTIQDLSVNLKEASRNSEQMVKQAQENSHTAEDGKKLNEELKSYMLAIQENELQFKDEMVQLQSNSADISNIVRLIADIAEQVNILALNASIEAVRAGEHGKGFSVVADEIRVLASKTQKSTKEIGPMIETIQDQVNRAVLIMDKNIESVQNVTAKVDYSSQMNEKIDVTSSKTLHMVEQTGKIYQETTWAFGGMNDQIEGASASSREVATAIRQVSDTIQQLTSGVEDLRELVERFVVHADKSEPGSSR